MQRLKPALTTMLAIAGCLLSVPRPSAAADKALLDVLLANGTLTREQYEALLDDDEPAAEDAADPRVRLDESGFSVRSSDGEFAIDIGARLHADFTQHGGDADTGRPAVDGTELRRARIELGGTFHGDWRWAAETDLADDRTEVKDFWLRYTGLAGVDLTVGHQKQPYSLDVEMSSNDIPFTERGIDIFLIAPFVDRAIGIRADASGERWFAAAGIYGESVAPGGLFGESEGIDPLVAGDEGRGAAGRFIYAPTIATDRVLHLGFRAAYREPADNPGPLRTLRIRDETTDFSNLSVVDTGFISNVRDATLFGPEAAWVRGPFSVYGEYNDARIGRGAGEADLSFASWHVAATWSLTGESRAAAYEIDAGEFKRLSPARPFRRGDGGGAWELAVRYSALDLNDGAFVGGSEKALTAGANWYVNDNVRMLLDWTHIVETDASNAIREGAEGMDIFRARAQFTF